MTAARTLELPRRFVVTTPISDRRVSCVCGHAFTPDAHLRSGRAVLRCRSCHRHLLVAVVRELRQKLVLEVTRSEVDTLDLMAVRPGVELLWLVLQPVGGCVDA